tara:strand:- start:67 stop:408 length:342 start_codon:yes stop_codon:yes gene_type:complete
MKLTKENFNKVFDYIIKSLIILMTKLIQQMENLIRKLIWEYVSYSDIDEITKRCYNCTQPIDIVHGYYVVAEWEHACSEKCTKQMLSEEEYEQGIKEWKEDGDSNIFYWTDWR